MNIRIELININEQLWVMRRLTLQLMKASEVRICYRWEKETENKNKNKTKNDGQRMSMQDNAKSNCFYASLLGTQIHMPRHASRAGAKYY